MTTQIFQTRTSFKPFKYPWAYDLWLAHEQSHWLHTELPFAEDVADFTTNKLTEGEKQFLTHLFRFFSQGDLDVAEGYISSYLPFFSQPEIRMMLLGFSAREALHIAAYSHLVETLGLPDSTYTEFMQYPAMVAKHETVKKYTTATTTFRPERVAALSAFTEGLQLFSSFVMLLNFPRRGLMKGMGQIITWSIADETMHVEGITRLFREIIKENKVLWTEELKAEIYALAIAFTELEFGFIDLAYSLGGPVDLPKEDVKRYVQYIADRRLIQLGLKGHFKVKKNPLLWVDEMTASVTHTNFFENRGVEYAKGALQGSWSEVWGVRS